MSENLVIKKQFDISAKNFDNWSVTQNEKMLQGLLDFCDLSKDKELLDVACGTGAFSLFSADKAAMVTGVDISEGMIAVALQNAADKELKNVVFHCQDVENINLPGKSFSVVVSKSAFHHMKNYQQVFSNMITYCKSGGRVCIQDIMAYEDDKVNHYFEKLELLIDESHWKTYSKREFFELFKSNSLSLLGIYESESLLNFYDYVGHVVQNNEKFLEIKKVLKEGLADKDIAAYFLEHEGQVLWKRKVCTIIGQK